MKKLLLLAIVLLSSAGIMAQEREGTLTVQPRVGMNLSSMTDYNKMKFGYAFGMEMEYQITDIFSLSAALMYSDQGAKDDETGTDEILDIDFVNVPIMLNSVIFAKTATETSKGVREGIVESSNSYFTSDFVLSSNKFTVDQTFEGSATDLFKDPENGDFTLKVSSVTAGDPRWIPEE